MWAICTPSEKCHLNGLGESTLLRRLIVLYLTRAVLHDQSLGEMRWRRQWDKGSQSFSPDSMCDVLRGSATYGPRAEATGRNPASSNHDYDVDSVSDMGLWRLAVGSVHTVVCLHKPAAATYS